MQRIIEVFNKCVVCGCETNGMYGDEYPVCFGCYRSGRLLEWQSTQQSVHPTAFGEESPASNSLQMSLFAEVPSATYGGG